MDKITQFNKANLAVLRVDIAAALDQIAQKHGIQSIKIGAISYSPTGETFSTKMEGITSIIPFDDSLLEAGQQWRHKRSVYTIKSIDWLKREATTTKPGTAMRYIIKISMFKSMQKIG